MEPMKLECESMKMTTMQPRQVRRIPKDSIMHLKKKKMNPVVIATISTKFISVFLYAE